MKERWVIDSGRYSPLKKTRSLISLEESVSNHLDHGQKISKFVALAYPGPRIELLIVQLLLFYLYR